MIGVMDWQLLVVAVCIVAAAAWLTWRMVRGFRAESSSGCGSGCGDCPRQDATADPTGFVSLDQLRQASARKD
jgi:hypothetical protein